MTVVRISETYDLSTQVNKMGIIGIHTPSVGKIKEVWGNAYDAHQRFRIVGCDVTIACASMLPADPLQIGTESGQIAPQDMFNPILYRAVSNDSYNSIANRIYGESQIASGIEGMSLVGEDLPAEGDTSYDAFNLYYGLLAEPDGWKKAMPQSGLSMKGLYPIVYQVVNTFGNTLRKTITRGGGDFQPGLDEVGLPYDMTGGPLHSAITFRGPSMRMPSLPTKVTQYMYAADDLTTPTQQRLGDSEIPLTYVACIVTPPAKLNKLYYRMKVTWSIELIGLRSDLENEGLINTANVGQDFYATDYVEQSKMMDTTLGFVDVKDADISLVMVGSK